MMKLLLFIWSFFIFSSVQAVLEQEKSAPDYLIIGAQKSGTTALQQYLNKHPWVAKTDKEIHFFDLQFEKGIAWYQEQFPQRTAPHVVGDKSPYYLFHPLVPERVFSLYPKIKLIIILRNPVDRAYSQYWHNIRHHEYKEKDIETFEEAVKAEFGRLAGEKEKFFKDSSYRSFVYQHRSYLSRGIYVEQIQRWLSFFPREQILILSHDEMLQNPGSVMQGVFSFLGLPGLCSCVGFPIEGKQDYPPMDSHLRENLSEFFHPYNQQLEELLQMKFNWK